MKSADDTRDQQSTLMSYPLAIGNYVLSFQPLLSGV